MRPSQTSGVLRRLAGRGAEYLSSVEYLRQVVCARNSGTWDMELLQILERDSQHKEGLAAPTASLEPPRSLRSWAPVLQSMGVDLEVCRSLGELASQDPMGYAEAYKILAHNAKPVGTLREPSGWVRGTCNEDSRYLGEFA